MRVTSTDVSTTKFYILECMWFWFFDSTFHCRSSSPFSSTIVERRFLFFLLVVPIHSKVKIVRGRQIIKFISTFHKITYVFKKSDRGIGPWDQKIKITYTLLHQIRFLMLYLLINYDEHILEIEKLRLWKPPKKWGFEVPK